ncbi:family 20 glycosylhydrolase [Streptomyces sp. NPDC054796]
MWPKKLAVSRASKAPRAPRASRASRAVLGASACAVLTLSACSGGGDEPGGSASSAGDHRTSSSSPTSDAPSPTAPAKIGPAPSAVPAVREWKAVRGPGWEPADGTRVVARDETVADEARLLAGEMKVPYGKGYGKGGEKARTGDIELGLDKGSEAKKAGREAYVLNSRDGKVTITGASDAGVFYGTRTLLQTVRDKGRFSDGVVKDRPDRAQRGFMLDIARKHFDAEWIERRIKEMGDFKLNQLQLHLSDDQAFRVESESHPEVVSEPHLTKDQLRRIIELAKARHIEVVPEIDSPGHLGAVIKAHPGLQLKNASGQATRGAVDISDPKAAKIVDDLLREYAKLFPGTYAHLGGDEYRALTVKDPAASYPRLASAARKKYGRDADVQDLATAWLNDRADTLRKAGKTPQVWNDGIHKGGSVHADKDRQVTYWTGKEIGAREPVEYLKEGWKLVNLNDEYLYYVLGEPNDFTYPTGERIYEEWTPAVLRGKKAVPSSLAGPDRILGGRFAVWCDIADAQSTDQIAKAVKAPLAATSQKLWNPEKPKLSWAEFKALSERVAS